jgi:hypothetical protein
MYDGLTGHYTFSCPTVGHVQVRLSAFRSLKRLPGASHPAVYRIVFACSCGGEHEGLVTHDDLDWAPLGASGAEFFNLMTARVESATGDLLDLAARRIGSGDWPWSFFCYPENRPQPVFPSAFLLLSPAAEELGLAVRCPVCECTTVNLVSRPHVDLPFYNDRYVQVVEHVFERDREDCVTAFRQELDSGAFDVRRRDLAA